MRIGHGFDLHRLVAGRVLRLGGVVVPFEAGLLGHSDGDAVLHAIADALLGALAEGDLGRHFPDSDPQNQDRDSADFVRSAMRRVQARGYAVGNLDVTIHAERPKLAPYIAAMRARVAELLALDVDRISIKAKTMEGLDAVGRGEAIAATAVVLIIPN
ncbi:MAG TPA: 2-C-methyl-D-erythritol 2,4-cyclodiphosphate synthase [Candidatus Kryptonia bacterium]|nr:2-C-methyl-D-erythritol 2,4-cyclodiphosphate synthase [Candidatus Kryptonia bacterium]